MGLIDKELRRKHTVEERLLRFAEFIREQKKKKSPGMDRACLQSEGYRDFYGRVVLGTGMHRGLWRLSEADNPKALLYTDESEAKEYAQKLQKLLRDNGYPFSKAWVVQVAVFTSKAHPYSGLILPTVTYGDDDRFLILMRIR